MTLRATGIVKHAAADWVVVLDAQGRHIRRKLLVTEQGEEFLVDLEKPMHLAEGDGFVLEDGRIIAIRAAVEPLVEVKATNKAHLARLAWHIGNRHLEAQIEAGRILIHPDHVIERMLEQQGATLRHVKEPFSPEHGAYHRHSHDHGH